MKWIVEDKLVNFKFWSGAADNAKLLTYSELEELENRLAFVYTPTATDINDLFWFKFQELCTLLGIFKEDLERRKKEIKENGFFEN